MLLLIISPAGFEGFFGELADLVAAGAFTMYAMGGLASGYGLSFGSPDWLPDVVAGFSLSVPPAA